MLEIFLAPLGTTDFDDPKWEMYVSIECWRKSRKWKSKKARNQTVGAELLLNWAFKDLGFKGIFPLQYMVLTNGKKVLLDSSYHFNLSHSENYVACAIADCPVGIDVQQIKKVNPNIVKRIFCAHETELFLPENTIQWQSQFFNYWVLKESYAKMTGEGLYFLGKRGIFTGIDPICILNGENQNPYSFQLWEDIPEYRMAVCMKTSEEIKSGYHFLSEDWSKRFPFPA